MIVYCDKYKNDLLSGYIVVVNILSKNVFKQFFYNNYDKSISVIDGNCRYYKLYLEL